MTHRTRTPVQNRDRNPNVFSTAEILELLSDIPGINAGKAEQIRRHWLALVQSEDRTDLTRLESARDIAIKHYLDCALPLKFVELPSPLLDIGSGAGFPGLVLKILSPETHVILGEVRPKRTRFLEQIIADLGLTGVEVFAHRIGPQFPLEIQGVVTRALESSRDTLYRVQPFLPKGGKVILLKGPKGDEEIAEAVGELTDFQHEKTFRYNLGNTGNERRLVVFTRTRESLRIKNEPGPSGFPAGKTVSRGEAARGYKTIEITSRANEQFKSLLSLGEARAIRKSGQFLVSGERLVREIAGDKKLSASLISIITEPALPAIDAPCDRVMLAPALFREVDFSGTKFPLALMRTPAMPEWQGKLEDGVTVFLPFQDPGNVGAAIRSAAAFGARRVVLLRESASAFLPKAVRAAANALFHVELFSGPSLDELIALGLPLYRLDIEGEDLRDIEFGKQVGLIPGVEGYGFKSHGKTIPVRIPIAGNVESLNAQSALSIALYEISRSQKVAQ
mgnify:CR=1 FL=1